MVKGTAVRSLLLGLTHATSREAVAKVRAALPEELRRQLDPVLLASRMHPIELCAAFHEAIRTELGCGTWTLNRRAGMEAAHIDLRGIYGVFVKLADPLTTISAMGRAWRQYNTHGEVQVEATGSDSARVRIEGVDLYNEGMWQSLAGRTEVSVQLAGAKRASTTIESWSPTGCQLVLRWTR